MFRKEIYAFKYIHNNVNGASPAKNLINVSTLLLLWGLLSRQLQLFAIISIRILTVITGKKKLH